MPLPASGDNLHACGSSSRRVTDAGLVALNL